MGNAILVVEDDHYIRVSFRQCLEEEGHKVYSAANGQDGLLLLAKVKPKLVVLDLGMPIMGGEEFLRIKNLTPELRNIPVLVVTCQMEIPEELKSNEHLLKPVELMQFLEKVGKCLRLTADQI